MGLLVLSHMCLIVLMLSCNLQYVSGGVEFITFMDLAGNFVVEN